MSRSISSLKNIMGKGEISSTEYFFLFPPCLPSFYPIFSTDISFFFCISMNRMAIIMYANLKKKELHLDNEGCVMNLRYIGYAIF